MGQNLRAHSARSGIIVLRTFGKLFGLLITLLGFALLATLVALAAASEVNVFQSTDSFVVVGAYNLPPAVYMRLGAADVDTFTFQYRVLEVTECCGTTYIPSSVRYNDGPEISWPTGTIELRK